MEGEENEKIEDVSAEVKKYVRDGALNSLRIRLFGYSPIQRKNIVCFESGTHSILSLACSTRDFSIVKYLVEEDCSNIEEERDIDVGISSKSLHQCTNLWYAASRGIISIAKILLENGANVHAVSNYGFSVFHAACKWSGDNEMLELLVASGADVNDKNKNGVTCLMSAVDYNSVSVCKFLLSNGANVNARDSHGKTCAHYLNATTEIVDILVEAHVDLNAKDNIGYDAIQNCAINNNEVIVRYLEKNPCGKTSSTMFAYTILSALSQFGDNMSEYWSKALRYFEKDFLDSAKPWICSYLPMVTDNSDESLTTLEKVFITSLQLLNTCAQFPAFYILCNLSKYYAHSSGDIRQRGKRVIAEILSHILKSLNLHVKPNGVGSVFFIAKYWTECYDTIESVDFKVLLMMFSLLVQKFVETLDVVHASFEEFEAGERKDVISLLKLIVKLVFIMYDNSSFLPINRLWQSSVDILVKSSLKHQIFIGKSLLHITLKRYKKTEGLPHEQDKKTARVIDTFVKLGCCVNHTDSRHNTPLHVLLGVIADNYDPKICKSYLLENGAHVDIPNSHGQTVLSLARDHGFVVCKVRYQTLQCLAACVILNRNICYSGHVSKEQKAFIDMHKHS